MSVLVIGSTNMDITIRTNRLPVKGETLLGKDICYRYGGKGANQACACAKLGSEVTFLTCVGDDNYGKEIVKSLANQGVKVDKVKYSKNKPTGTAVINVDDKGANSIIVVQGANLECDKEYILENEESIKNNDYILLQMEIPMPAIETAIELAAKYNKKVILNPAPADNSLDKKVYKYITYMTPNETEAEIMAYGEKKNGDFAETAVKLLGEGIENVVITLGSKGARLYKKDSEVIEIPACKVNAIDTVAAGDCFNGAFISAIDKGKSEKEAMKFANFSSAVAVTRRGAQESIPTIEEVLDFKNNFKEEKN